MKYKNQKTGVIINVQSVINGGDWLPVGQQAPVQAADKKQPSPVVAKPAAAPAQSSADAPAVDGITVKEIKQELDAMGVKYNPTAKKQELYDLMMGK